MVFFSQLGNPLVFVLFVAVVFWSVDSGVGQRMALFTFAAGSVNEVLKRAFNAPRPFWVSSGVRSIGEGSTAFGMPSGHSVGAFAWLIIPLRVRRTWAWIVFGVVAVMIGLSRIYLGAHFPSQVLAGWVVGALLLFVFVHYERPFLAWFESMPLQRRLGLVVVATAVVIGAGALSAAALDDFEVEPEWERNVAGQIDESEPFDPVDVTDLGSTSGIFAGTAIGLVLLADRGGLSNARNVRQRLARLVVGLVCMTLALVVIGSLGGASGLDDEGGFAGAAWQFASLSGLGFVIFYAIPLAFDAARLTRPPEAAPKPAAEGARS